MKKQKLQLKVMQTVYIQESKGDKFMATIRVNSKMMRDKASSFEKVANSINVFTNEMTQEIESLK